MKPCSACKALKPLDEFQVRVASPDGRTAACRACLKDRDKARYEAERERRLQRHAAYVATPIGAAAHKRAVDRWRAANADKAAAHRAVAKALLSGKLARWPCEVCGNAESHAHHPSYDKAMRLVVVWLCDEHHKEVHAMPLPGDILPPS